MLIFLDTEFTDFNDPDLISIGLVDETGREFYAERTDYCEEMCSDFVVKVVKPLLKQHPKRVEGTRFKIARELNEWLQHYGDTMITVCFDYSTDWHLFNDLLSLLPEEEIFNNLRGLMIWGDIDQQALEWFWKERDCIGWNQHMALYDAHANMFAYKPKVRERNG